DDHSLTHKRKAECVADRDWKWERMSSFVRMWRRVFTCVSERMTLSTDPEADDRQTRRSTGRRPVSNEQGDHFASYSGKHSRLTQAERRRCLSSVVRTTNPVACPNSGLCSWAALLLFYTVSVHVQGVQSQSATTDLPVATLPSTISDPTTALASTPNAPTVPDSPSTVTNIPPSTVQLTTSDSQSLTSDRTNATPTPTPTPTTFPQITTGHDLLVTTTPEITTRIPTTAEPPTAAPTTTPEITTTDLPATTHELPTTAPATSPQTTTPIPPTPTTTPESPTTVPTTTPQVISASTDLPTTAPEITTPIPAVPTTTPEPPTTTPTTTPEILTTSHDLPATTPETTPLPTTTPEPPTTTPATTPETTHVPTTTPELTTPIPPEPPTTPTPPIASTAPDVPTTVPIPTTTPQITTVTITTDFPTTTPELTTPIPTTTPEPPTTTVANTTPQVISTSTDLPSTPLQITTTDAPTATSEITTTDVATTTVDVPTTHSTTTNAPVTTPQITTTAVSTTLPQIIIGVTPDISTPEPATTNPPVQTTSVPPTTTPAPTTTIERTTTIPTTTPDPPTPTPDVPTTTPSITTSPEVPTTTPYSPTTVPQIVTTTSDVPTTPQITTATTALQITTLEITTPIPPIPSTIPDVPTTVPIPTTTPEITTVTTTTDFPTTPIPTTTPEPPTTTPEITTPIPIIPTTTPEPPITTTPETTTPIPTTTPEPPTTTPEITTPIPIIPTTTPEPPTTTTPETTTPSPTTTPEPPTTTPEITTPIPIIPTTTPQPTTTPEVTTPEPPTTTTPQIITTSTDLPTTNAPIPTTTPESPTTIPDSPTTSPQPASTGGPLVVVSPVDNTGLTTTEIGNSTTVPPRDVDLWMPIVAGVGASMVLDEKYLTDEEEMLPLGKTNGTASRAPREKRPDRPDRNSTARKKTDTKPKNAEKFLVKESYKSEAEDQISLVKGEEVEVINKPTDDWWFGRSQNKIGWFPTKHLQSAGSVTPTGADNAGFVNDEDSSSLPDPPPSLQATPPPSITAGSDATLPARAIVETSDDDVQQRRPSLSNLSLPPPPPELLAHEDETAPPVRSADNISIGSVSTSASLRNMSLGTLDLTENTPPNGRSDSPESLASTAQSVSSSRPPSRASYVSRTPSTLGSPNIPWMGSVGRSHVRTHPRVKAVLKNGQPDPAEENRMHLIMNTNLPDRDASMRGSRRSSEDRSGRDRKLSMALRLSEPESALELDLPPPPPEFDSPKPADASPLTERYIAVYAYRATDDNQLNLEEDDVITVNERDPLGWARGVCIQTGKEGWFPESYVKKLGEDKKDSKATRANGPPQRPAPKPPTDKAKRVEAEPSSVPDPSVQSGQDTLTRPQLRPRPSVRKSLMNKQPSVKGPSEVFYSPSDADDGPGRPTVAVRPSSHEHPAPLQQNRGTFGAPPPPIQSEKSPTYSTAERKLSVRASGPPLQGSVQESAPVKPPRQPSQRHSVATTPKPPTIVRSPSRRVSMPINFDLLEESSIDDTPGQGSQKSRRPPNLNLGSFPPHPQQETGPTSPLSRSRPSRSSVTAAPDIMKTLEELDLQDTQLRTAIETFTMRGPGYLNFTKGDVILELEESDIPGWSYGELQDGTRGIFPVSSTENAATFV
ncbi:Cytoplasmic protein nck2, partial [Branchiostoma belcheri]